MPPEHISEEASHAKTQRENDATIREAARQQRGERSIER